MKMSRSTIKLSGRIISGLLLIIVISVQLPVGAKAMESSSELETLTEAMDSYVRENNPNEAAVAVGLVSKDQVLYEESYGYADKAAGTLADADTVYEWGSLSKVLTWISVMQLYEEGKIDLDEDIRVYLPEGFLTKLSYDTPVTMLDLMNHTGGFQDSITGVYTTKPEEIHTLEEYLKNYEPVQLYEPGTTVAYSNWGCSLAGYIVECISGESYCDYVNEHIFVPLQMNYTSIDPLRRDNSLVDSKLNEIIGYTTDGSELRGRYYAPDYPAAGAAGTVSDVMLLMQDLLTKSGGKLFTNTATYDEFFSATRVFEDSVHPENCHGMWTDFYQTQTTGHYGNTVQFSVHMSISEDMGLIVMTNQAQEMRLNEGLGEVVFGTTHPEITPDANWSKLQFLDCYTSARTIEHGFCKFYHFFQLYRVEQAGENNLVLSSLMMPMPLSRVGETEYVVTDGFAKGYHIFMDVDENGVVQKMSTSTFDFVPYSAGLALIEMISFIAFAVALVLFMIALIRWIIACVKKKKPDPFTGIMILCSLSYYGVVFMEMMRLISTAAVKSEMWGYIIFYALYLVLWMWYVIRNCAKKKWNGLSVLTIIGSLAIVFYILYWQMILIGI